MPQIKEEEKKLRVEILRNKCKDILHQKLNKEIPGTWAEDFWKQIEKDLKKKKNQLVF